MSCTERLTHSSAKGRIKEVFTSCSRTETVEVIILELAIYVSRVLDRQLLNC